MRRNDKVLVASVVAVGILMLWIFSGFDETRGHVEADRKSDIEMVDPDTVMDAPAPKVEPIEARGTVWEAKSFRMAGQLEYNGLVFTWYSQKIIPGDDMDELNSNGRRVSEEGYVIDGDGFISAASSEFTIGTEMWTPVGNVKVYDNGRPPGVVDIYTDW